MNKYINLNEIDVRNGYHEVYENIFSTKKCCRRDVVQETISEKFCNDNMKTLVM